MRYHHARLETIAYDLPPNVLTSEALEDRLAPVYDKLRLRHGQLEALTGIRERRIWDAGRRPSEGAIRAGRKALERSSIPASRIGALIYAAVCRDNHEPATACVVADALGLSPRAEIFDLSNACLGVMNAILDMANRIELGHIEAGMIVSCETSREIIDVMVEQMNADPAMEMFKSSLATLTGGSGAAALIMTNSALAPDKPRLLGGVLRSAPAHHALCRWGDDERTPPRASQYFETDAVNVLKHGVALGRETWAAFLDEMDWTPDDVDKVIMHQVGANNRDAILRAIGQPAMKDFSTFEYLGNMGAAALPVAAAIAAERGHLRDGDRVGFLGIGSGLNCLMLGWEWRA